jgi:hypothetical protein
MRRASFVSRRALAVVVSLTVLATAEIQEFNVLLPATSTEIRYTSLYLRGPGSVDVSRLILTAISEVHTSYYPTTQDDDYNANINGGTGDVAASTDDALVSLHACFCYMGSTEFRAVAVFGKPIGT